MDKPIMSIQSLANKRESILDEYIPRGFVLFCFVFEDLPYVMRATNKFKTIIFTKITTDVGHNSLRLRKELLCF